MSDSDRSKPKPQEIYRHFKDENKLYQIITIASHTETGEEMVVYQAMYGDFKMYVRPLSMFISKTDMVKYPEASSEYRFERVESTKTIEETEESEETPNGDLIRFLDADTYEERRNLLMHMKSGMTDRLIDDIAASMDVTVEKGDIDQRFESLLKCVQTLGRYEITRL